MTFSTAAREPYSRYVKLNIPRSNGCYGSPVPARGYGAGQGLYITGIAELLQGVGIGYTAPR
jgi:hypothetical protein